MTDGTGVIDSEVDISHNVEVKVEKNPQDMAIDWINAAAIHYEIKANNSSDTNLKEHFEAQASSYRDFLKKMGEVLSEEDVLRRDKFIEECAKAQKECLEKTGSEYDDAVGIRAVGLKPPVFSQNQG